MQTGPNNLQKKVAVLKNCRGSALSSTQFLIDQVLFELGRAESSSWFMCDQIDYAVKQWKSALYREVEEPEASKEFALWVRKFNEIVEILKKL